MSKYCSNSNVPLIVAPYTGAWIEIKNVGRVTVVNNVAPYTGAWIEIPKDVYANLSARRTLHGCVD